MYGSSAIQLKAQDTIKIREVFINPDDECLEETHQQSIDSARIQEYYNKDLGSALQKHTHAFVKSYGIGSLATVSLRGSGSNHTNLNWNGTNLNSSSNGVVDFSLIPTFFTEDVSVNYGQSSLQYGAGGIGGAVEMKNKIDFNSNEKLSIQQELGSFNYHSSAFKLRLGQGKWRSVSKLLFRASENDFEYSDISEEGAPRKEIKNAALSQKGILQSFHYLPKVNQRMDLHIWYFDSERELPNLMTLRDLEESQYDENFRTQLNFEHYKDQTQLSFNSTFLQDNIIYRNNQLEENSTSVNRSIRNYAKAKFEWKQYVLKFRLDADFDQSIQKSLEDETVERSRQALFTQLDRSIAKSMNIGLAARQEVVVSQYFLLPQIRWDLFAKNRSINYWVLLGKNMKYPSLNDLYWSVGGNKELKAEESNSIELGQLYRFKIADIHQFQLKLNMFYSYIENYIQWAPTEFGYWRAENLKEVESKGIELDLSYQNHTGSIKQKYSFLYNYVNSINMTKGANDDASYRKQLIYVPEHQYDLNANWQYRSYSLNVNWQFVSARYLLTDNTDFLPYYELVDISFDKQWRINGDQISLGFAVRNLLDSDYQTIQWRPMPGRNFMIHLKYSFGS